MYLYIPLVFILLSEKVFAASYNQRCSNDSNCNLPGLICFDGRCVCNWKLELFWTNARCLVCPKGWMRTETRCVIYMGIRLSWTQAQENCVDMQSELLSYRNDSTISLIYQLTTMTNRRKKQVETASDKTVVWTSGHVVEFDNLGLYQWLDKSLPLFNSKSNWWCKVGMPGFAYNYGFNEPTRYIRGGIKEQCLLSRRGTTNTMALCLDDVLCEEKYPFICEKSESTAQSYIGPPPSSTDISTNSATGVAGSSSTSRRSSSSTSTSHRSNSSSSTSRSSSTSSSTSDSSKTSSTTTDGVSSPNITTRNSSSSSSSGSSSVIMNTNSTAHYDHHGIVKLSPQSLEENEKSKSSLILFIIFGLLLLIGVLVGIFFFLKYRNEKNTQHINDNERTQMKFNASPHQPEIDTKPANIPDVNTLEPQRTQSDETGLALNASILPDNTGFNIANQKQQKNRKGGFSTQQFADEFE